MFESAQKCGLRFECTQCSYCCTGSPGYVWLSGADIDGLLEFLGLAFDDFVQRYCRYVEVEGGHALSLAEEANYDCVFLKAGGCSVYGARPVQCRTYPFWDEILDSERNWMSEAKYCPGIGKGLAVPPEKIAETLLLGQSNPRFLVLDKAQG